MSKPSKNCQSEESSSSVVNCQELLVFRQFLELSPASPSHPTSLPPSQDCLRVFHLAAYQPSHRDSSPACHDSRSHSPVQQAQQSPSHSCHLPACQSHMQLASRDRHDYSHGPPVFMLTEPEGSITATPTIPLLKWWITFMREQLMLPHMACLPVDAGSHLPWIGVAGMVMYNHPCLPGGSLRILRDPKNRQIIKAWLKSKYSSYTFDEEQEGLVCLQSPKSSVFFFFFFFFFFRNYLHPGVLSRGSPLSSSSIMGH